MSQRAASRLRFYLSVSQKKSGVFVCIGQVQRLSRGVPQMLHPFRPALSIRIVFITLAVVSVASCAAFLAYSHGDSAKIATRVSNSKSPDAEPSAVSNDDTRARVSESYGKLPLSFEVNRGQADKRVKFLSRGNTYSVFLGSAEAI